MLNRIKISLILIAICVPLYGFLDIVITIAGLTELILLFHAKKITKAFLLAGIAYISMFLLAAPSLNATIFIYNLMSISLFHIIILHAIISDTAGYIIGSTIGKYKLFGKYKLAASVSPNKTIEGSIASIAGCLFFGLLLRYKLHNWPIGLSIIFALCAIIGDLLISKAKRMHKLKGSSTILQHHGGIWDRIDSIIFPTLICFLLKHADCMYIITLL